MKLNNLPEALLGLIAEFYPPFLFHLGDMKVYKAYHKKRFVSLENVTEMDILNYPLVEVLNISNSPRLVVLPKLPFLKRVYLVGCPNFFPGQSSQDYRDDEPLIIHLDLRMEGNMKFKSEI